eukprot:UN03848
MRVFNFITERQLTYFMGSKMMILPTLNVIDLMHAFCSPGISSPAIGTPLRSFSHILK